MPKISRYNHDTHALEWVDATQDEYEAWRTARAEKAAETRRTKIAPAGRAAKGGKRHSGSTSRPAGATASASDGDTDTLDDATGEAIRQAAKGAGKPKASGGPLTPIIGLVSRLGAIGLISVTARLTAGKHPMTPPEAISIAAPALRIADRELGKRVRWAPKNGPNTRDLEQMGTGLVTYVLRSLFGGAVPMPGPMPNPAQSPEAAMAASQTAPAPAREYFSEDVATAPDAADESDLFSGSEPVGKGAAHASVPGSVRAEPGGGGGERSAGPPGAVRVPDAVWNQLSTPEIGLAEVMA